MPKINQSSHRNNRQAFNQNSVMGIQPLYLQVREHILQAMSRGEWKLDEAIPSEKQLCERFSVSVGTLRKGIDSLVDEHILVRHQGRGTFVANHSLNTHFFQFFKVAPFGSSKVYPEVELLDFQLLKSNAEVAQKLELETREPVFHFRNLLKINDEPAVLDHIYLPAKHFTGLTAQMLRTRPSTLYNFYQDVYQHNIIQIDERVRACLIDVNTAKLLAAKRGAAALEARRIAYSYNMMPVEWRISIINTEAHEYVHSSIN